ncbi:P-loop containing nucleoside triphosphate hydrolase protein [Xylariomycetidae sp. FL2044]|nr:P-loop containing nucleoside triphosphate hydrolase protein [Xylariomycetidae sp. FL2044]
MEQFLERLRPRLIRSPGDPRPVVLMACGIAGSGKTTLTKAIISTHATFERLSLDATTGKNHGLYAIDYPPEVYEQYQEESATECDRRLLQILREGKRDAVLERSFYAKEDRDHYKTLIEANGGRWVLVYLRAPSKAFLWERIVRRRENGINADSAFEITKEILDRYWAGWEAPLNEGELVFNIQ